MSAQKFQTKPVVVEAMQWDGTAEHAGAIVDWVRGAGYPSRYIEGAMVQRADEAPHWEPAFIALKGGVDIHPQDWVVRDDGRPPFHRCKPDIFEATYEAVSS